MSKDDQKKIERDMYGRAKSAKWSEQKTDTDPVSGEVKVVAEWDKEVNVVKRNLFGKATAVNVTERPARQREPGASPPSGHQADVRTHPERNSLLIAFFAIEWVYFTFVSGYGGWLWLLLPIMIGFTAWPRYRRIAAAVLLLSMTFHFSVNMVVSGAVFWDGDAAPWWIVLFLVVAYCAFVVPKPKQAE